MFTDGRKGGLKYIEKETTVNQVFFLIYIYNKDLYESSRHKSDISFDSILRTTIVSLL